MPRLLLILLILMAAAPIGADETGGPEDGLPPASGDPIVDSSLIPASGFL